MQFVSSRVVLGALLLVHFVAALSGCAPPPTPLTDRNSALTQGAVQMTLVVGQTNKAQVLEAFGAPNITTRDGSGLEVWTYQRAAQVSQSSERSGHWTVLLAKPAALLGGLAGMSTSASGFESTSRMVTLIIKFDGNDVVTDFRSRTSNF